MKAIGAIIALHSYFSVCIYSYISIYETIDSHSYYLSPNKHAHIPSMEIQNNDQGSVKDSLQLHLKHLPLATSEIFLTGSFNTWSSVLWKENIDQDQICW